MELTYDELRNYFAKATMAIKHWQFGNKMQLAFLEDLYLLINDGIPANRAVDMMSQVTAGITREVAYSISQGRGARSGRVQEGGHGELDRFFYLGAIRFS